MSPQCFCPSQIPSRRILMVVVVLVGLLALANIVDLMAGKPFWPITQHIDLGSDTNMAAWFSSILLAMGGLVALQCASRAARLGQAPWFHVLALFMFLMSCDELARLHETIFGDIAKLAEISGLSMARHAAWVWVGGPVIAALFIVMAWMMRGQFASVPGTMTWLVAGLGTMFLGGVVLESTINFLNADDQKLLWQIEAIIEETLEMLGSFMVVNGLMQWRDADTTG